MSTKYIASNWRLPNQENSSKSDNYGLTFDGSEYIDLDIQSLTTPATISIWVNTAVNDSQQRYAIINGRADQTPYLYLRMATDNTYQVLFFNSNGSDTLQGSSATINTWFHFVIVCENSQTLLYENGVLKDTSTTGWNGVNIDQSNNWQIGRDSRGQRFWSGSISECAFFDYALSSTQISTLYGSSELGSTSPMALKPQPVAYYPLGDNSASNPLTQPNEAVEDASVFEFDSSFIDCGDSDDFSFTDGSNDLSYSFSAWVNADTLSTDLNQPNTIISKYGTSTNEWWFLIENKKLVIINYDQSNPTIIGRKYDTDLSPNTWYHIAATYDGSKNVTGFKLYLDGVRVDDTNYNANSTYGGMQNQVQNVFIGKRDRATRLSYFDGQINNTQIWQAELSSSEIETLYNSGVPLTGTQPQESNLKAWYKLDQSANWEADSSGAWQIPDAVSAYPQSFNFDAASSDYIEVTSSSDFDFGTDGFTISAWVNTTGTTAQHRTVVCKQNPSNSNEWTLQVNTNGKVNFYGAGGSVDVLSTTTVNDGKWHNILIKRSGSVFELYIDNVLADQETVASQNLTNTANLRIGHRNTGYNAYFDGKISNVQIWTTALPATGTDSVETLYNNGVPLTTAIASDNLKGWWKLDNTATFSTNWSIPDASGNGNTGTSSGMTEQNLVNNNVSVLNGDSSGMTSANLVLSDLTRAVPYDSYSFNFDSASSDYIDTTLDIDANSDFSISFWFNWDTDQKVIITDGSFDAWSSIGYGFQIMSNGSVSFLVGDNGSSTGKTISSTAGSISANTWNHIVGVCDLSNEIRLYLNGTSVDSTAVGSSRNETSNNLRIAGDYSSSKRPFDGKISNISVFNESLTSTEVMKLYSNGVPQDLTNFTPQPVAFYPLGSNSFWNGSQWTVRDMIGSNDGTGQNIGVDGLVGDAPRSEANGTGTNMDVPSNLEGSTKWSDNNSWSINMSETARVEDTP